MADDRRHDGTTQHHAASQRRAARSFGAGSEQLDKTHLDALMQAALSTEWNAPEDTLQHVLDAGVAPEVLADGYIPTLARIMGEQWCSDEMGFATVTIGTARLQAMLRQLGQHWNGDSYLAPDAPTILVVVAADIYHTLGAMVLASQLRRKGVSVRLMLGATPPQVAERTLSVNFDAVFLSASCGETLESLRKIVDSVAQRPDRATPVVIGGTILTDSPEVQSLTGADFVTNDPDEALAFCGLNQTLSPAPANEQQDR